MLQRVRSHRAERHRERSRAVVFCESMCSCRSALLCTVHVLQACEACLCAMHLAWRTFRPASHHRASCSLRADVERLAFSVIWEVTPEVQPVRVEYTKSIIRSRAALTYEQAQVRIDDAAQTDEVTTSLRLLMKVAKVGRKRRCG
jgi:RNB domain